MVKGYKQEGSVWLGSQSFYIRHAYSEPLGSKQAHLLHCEPQRQEQEGKVGLCTTATVGPGASPSLSAVLCVLQAGEAPLPPAATLPGGHVRFSSPAPTLRSPPRSCKWLIRNCLAMASRGCVY